MDTPTFWRCSSAVYAFANPGREPLQGSSPLPVRAYATCSSGHPARHLAASYQQNSGQPVQSPVDAAAGASRSAAGQAAAAAEPALGNASSKMVDSWGNRVHPQSFGIGSRWRGRTDQLLSRLRRRRVCGGGLGTRRRRRPCSNTAECVSTILGADGDDACSALQSWVVRQRTA